MIDHNVAEIISDDDPSVSLDMELLRYYDNPIELKIRVTDTGADMAVFGNFSVKNIENIIQALGKFLYIMQKENEK